MRRFFVPAGLLASSLALVATQVSAVETITVRSYRTPQPIERAGTAVTIVDRETIEMRQTAIAVEALRGVPGLSIARSGPIGAQTQLRMRGAEANQVLVLIDGVEANDLATDDAFSFEHLTAFDIENIEVVRGPQSALWGSDALAGVINVVTRQPEQPFETEGYLEGGSFDTINGGARLGLRSEDAWLAASASSLDLDGSNAAREGGEDDGYANTTGNIAGRVRIAPGLSLDASLRHTDATAEFDGNDFVDGVLVAVDADNESDIRQNFARAGAELIMLDSRLTQALHYALAGTDTDTTSEDSFTGELANASTNGKKYGLYYRASLRVDDGGDENPGDQLSVAVDHEREEFRQRGEVSVFGDPNQDQTLHTTGYAIEYLAFLGRDWSLAASARHDDNSDFGDVNTWRATASWQLPASATRLHGSFGTGQKAPTFFERYGFTPDTFVGNPDLEPETSKGWDAGIEQRWLGDRLLADLTYFRADLENEINGFFCPPPDFVCTAVNEPGESERRGVEATLALELTDAYAIEASYTYLDASQSNVQPDGTDPGATEVRRPRHAGSLVLSGAWTGGRLRASAGAYYTGEREDDAFLLDPPFVTRVELDDYTLVNVAASFDVSDYLSVYGRIENALDEDYEDVFGYATPGIAAYAGVRVRMR
jgi:vitamin B12 transporter